MEMDDNKKIPPPPEDKLIYLFKTIPFQPTVLTRVSNRGPFN